MNSYTFERIAIQVKKAGTPDAFVNNPSFNLCRSYDLDPIRLTIRQDIWSISEVKALYLEDIPVVVKRGSDLHILDPLLLSRLEELIPSLIVSPKETKEAVKVLKELLQELEDFKPTFVSKKSVIKLIEQKIQNYGE